MIVCKTIFFISAIKRTKALLWTRQLFIITNYPPHTQGLFVIIFQKKRTLFKRTHCTVLAPGYIHKSTRGAAGRNSLSPRPASSFKHYICLFSVFGIV